MDLDLDLDSKLGLGFGLDRSGKAVSFGGMLIVAVDVT